MKRRSLSATEFKAKCLSLLDEVHNNGDIITITKHGRPIATLQPLRKWKSPEGMWAGKVEIVRDIVNIDLADMWDCVREREGRA